MAAVHVLVHLAIVGVSWDIYSEIKCCYFIDIIILCIGESDQTVMNTKTMCDRPLPVRNLGVSDVDSNYITFEWEPPVFANGSEMTYMVSWY